MGIPLAGCQSPFELRSCFERKVLQPEVVGGLRIMWVRAPNKISTQFQLKLF